MKIEYITDPDMPEGMIEIRGVKKQLPDEISIEWHIDDVKSVDEDREDDSVAALTDDECREVLQRVKRGHDATLGVNWEVIEFYADEVRDERV